MLALDATHVLLNVRRIGPFPPGADTSDRDGSYRPLLPDPLEVHRFGEASMRAGLIVSEPGEAATMRLLQEAVDFVPTEHIPQHLDRLLANTTALHHRERRARSAWRLLFHSVQNLWVRVARTYGDWVPRTERTSTNASTPQ